MSSVCSLLELGLNSVEEVGPSTASESANPFTLPVDDLIPAGVICLRLCDEAIPCDVHESHLWHRYDGDVDLTEWLRHDSDEDFETNGRFIQELDYLVSSLAVVVELRVSLGSAGHPCIYIRVYLIPSDLTLDTATPRKNAKTRRFFQALLPRLHTDTRLWNAETIMEDNTVPDFLISRQADNRTLAEIYNSLASPVVHPLQGRSDVDNILNSGNIPGLKSTLYRYQRQTVAAMIQREGYVDSVPDPSYIAVTGVNGVEFFLQPTTMQVLPDQPNQAQTRGGVLCEEMGTGKTVIILALIMATMDELPAPETFTGDPLPVLTPLSFRYSRSPACAAARDKIPLRHRNWPGAAAGRRGVPSLFESALDVCRLNPGAAGIRQKTDMLKQKHPSIWRSFEQNTPFYLCPKDTASEDVQRIRSTRLDEEQGLRTLFISAGTLIVVPPNLVRQWSSEINKHCDDSLRVCVVLEQGKRSTARGRHRTEQSKLLTARELALKDIVIISHSRISHELANWRKIDQLYSSRVCCCASASSFDRKIVDRTPNCVCDHPGKDVSPLLHIHWKRLLVDEGDNLSSTSSNIVRFLKNVKADSKWIVTGTPSTNLMGLRLGTGDLLYPEEGGDDEGEDDSNLQADEPRVWTQEDRKDLNNLSHLFSLFLEMPPFAAGPQVFTDIIIEPLMDRTGPRPASIRILTQVMQNIMIRHRVEDIEEEVVLPVMTQETVLLDMDPYAVKTFNVMQAKIALNAVTSEREDQDYLFHSNKSSRTALQAIIEKISQSMFWFTIDNVDVEGPSELGRAYLRNTSFMNKISAADKELLTDSIAQLESAKTDRVWTAMQKEAIISPRVYDFPPQLYVSWSHFSVESQMGQMTAQPSDPSGLPSIFHFLSTDRLSQLRNYVVAKPHSQIFHLTDVGEMVKQREEHKSKIDEANESIRKASRRKREPRVTASLENQQKRKEAEKWLKEMGMTDSALAAAFDDPPYEVLETSPLAGVRWGNTPSAKLNFILSEVHQFSSAAKFLVFSKHPLTLAYIAEGLALLNVKYTTTVQLPIKEIEQNVTTFESSDTLRVFLMELKYGARGLNIVSASRVIFCEPVWEADVEAQAIKRVHRIGQASPVIVKTLAIRSTVEEALLNRRAALKDSIGTSGKLPKLTKDVTMRGFIANPKFLPSNATSNSEVVIDFPLLPVPPRRHPHAGDSLAEDLDMMTVAPLVSEAPGPSNAPESPTIHLPTHAPSLPNAPEPSNATEPPKAPKPSPAPGPSNAPGLSPPRDNGPSSSFTSTKDLGFKRPHDVLEETDATNLQVEPSPRSGLLSKRRKTAKSGHGQRTPTV